MHRRNEIGELMTHCLDSDDAYELPHTQEELALHTVRFRKSDTKYLEKARQGTCFPPSRILGENVEEQEE